jgi:DNA polymerase
MSDAYSDLLEATIRHLEQLKGRGVRFVSVSPGTLAGLGQGRQVAPRLRPRASTVVTPPAQAPRPRVEAPLSRPALPLAPKPPEDKPAPGRPLTPGLPGLPGAVSAGPAMSAEAKAAAFAQLRSQVMPCVKCAPLAAARKNVVFGVGDINARLMFIGEAPGSDEDEQGEPFVGRAGQLLTRIIQTMGLTRNSVYIANVLKCRPDTPGQASGNRKPTPQEMQTCIPYLRGQIDLIGPKVIVTLGATALEGLIGKNPAGIMRLRGHWQTFGGIPLMPTYHPAYLLRNQSSSEKRKVWEDMLEVMAKLGLPITEKQRNYFL